jgi:putative endopeptidase
MAKTIRNKKSKNKIKPRLSKTRKNVVPKDALALCPQRFVHIEDNYKKKFQNEISKSYKEMHNNLLHAFNIPFSPSAITPQTDFYTWINYRWIKDTVKKYKNKDTPNRYFVEVDIFRLTQDKVYRELFVLVKKFIANEKSKKRDAIHNVYKSLLNLNSQTIHSHFKEMPTLYAKFQSTNNVWEWMAFLNENEIISWGVPIFWSVTEDPKNSTIFCDSINPPRLSLYDYLLYLGDYGQNPKYIKYKKSVVSHYIKYIDRIFDSCLGKDHGLNGRDVFDVEVDILTAMGCDGVKNEDPDGYNKVTSGEALEKYGFDWKQFCKFLGYTKVPDYFICSNLNYLKCISKYLQENWKTKKFKAYIFYIILRQMIRFDSKLVNIYYDFNDKFIEGQPDPFPKELYPIFGLSYTFNTFLTEEYVTNYWNEEYVAFVENMATNLLTVFKRIMRRNTWLSETTKSYALKKLDHLELTIARPKKLRDDPLLDYSPTDAWYNMTLISTWKKNKYLNLQGKEVIDIPLIDWKQFKLIGTQAYVVNAYYQMNKNKIFVPMAIMQKPFINLDQRGFQFNLARMGYTLGHEMSHSLDNTGSKYDYKGNLHNWWKPEDKKKYNLIVKDIIKQYETFASYDGVKFNAEITAGEDMADISGMAICQEYLLDYFEVNNVITPVRDLMLKEFYVHYASHQRQHIYKRAVNAQLGTNPHPLDKYRTNCVLARLDLFKVMYNIKRGDKMFWPTNDVNSTIWN